MSAPDELTDEYLRAYFAAHAPNEIPNWFVFERPPIRPAISRWHALAKVPGFEALSTEGKRDAAAWLADPCYDPSDDIEPICKEAQRLMGLDQDRFEAERRAAEAARYFAWRWHYADQMLKISKE